MVAMAFWINIHGCQPYPNHCNLVNQLKNDSYCQPLCIKPINHLIRPHLQQTTYQKVFIFFDILTVQIIVSCRRKANNRKKGGGWSKLTGVQRLLLLAEQCSKASGASLDMDTTGCQPVCIRVNPLMVIYLFTLSSTCHFYVRHTFSEISILCGLLKSTTLQKLPQRTKDPLDPHNHPQCKFKPNRYVCRRTFVVLVFSTGLRWGVSLCVLE